MSDDATTRLASARGRGIVLAAVAGSSVAMLDGTVVNVALPHIGREFQSGIDSLQWIVTGYTLMLASLVLVGGALADRYGRRRVFLVGIIWFGVASVLCGLAPNAVSLIIARVLQGIGAGILTPGSLAIIQSTIHKDDRARAIGAWSGLGGVATAVGPFLGGWLVDAWSWHWVFFINVPIVAVAVAAAWRCVPETRDTSATGGFDLTGSVLGAVFLGGVTYALVQNDPPGPALILAGVGLLAGAAFLVVEHRRANPVMPPVMFSERQFSAINAVTFCVYASLGGLMFFIVMQLQVSAGYNALEAGISMMPFTVLMLLFSARAGAMGDRLGPRIPLSVGTALSAIGVVMLLFSVGRDAPYLTHVLPGVLVMSVGMTITVAPLTASVLAAAAPERAGIASGINNAIARAATLLAVAALPMIAGLSGAAYDDPDLLTAAYRVAMACCAGLFVVGALISVVWVRGRATEPDAAQPVARRQCAYPAPSLDPGRESELRL